MPTIWREAGFRFGFKMGDGKIRRHNVIVERPHVDAVGRGGSMKVWLDTLEIAEAYGLTRADIADALRIIQENQAEMLDKWREVFGE